MINENVRAKVIRAKDLHQLKPGDVIAEDIYMDTMFMLRKGNSLAGNMINWLHNNDVKSVMIEEFETLHVDDSINEQILNTEVSTDERANSEDIFFQTLGLVGNESRYGKLLHADDNIDFLKELFITINHIPHFRKLLISLRNWDSYTFLHSFDVFVLGTITAKRLGLNNLFTIATGYLFHDIGKIKVSQNILHKKRKLSYEELVLYKKHTIEGETILHGIGEDRIAHFARSHHEKLDGTGYPDQLADIRLGDGLRLLKIIDAYSSFTLAGSGQRLFAADVAIQMLYRTDKLYDRTLLKDFIEALHIYPVNATVILTDQTVAKVITVDPIAPTVPNVMRLTDTENFTLPLNFSTTIDKMLNYDVRTMERRQQLFTEAIETGDEDAALNEFIHLIDDRHMEYIYSDFLLPAYWKAVDGLRKEKLSRGEFSTRLFVIKNLLDHLNIERKQASNTNYKQRVLFMVDAEISKWLSIKFVLDLLRLENISPFIITMNYKPSQIGTIRSTIEAQNITEICYLYADGKKIWTDSNTSFYNVKTSHINESKLTEIVDELSKQTNQSLNLYESLFHSY